MIELARPPRPADPEIAESDRFHHDLMEAALRLIEDSARSQPGLDALAERMGLSPAHFQKLFTKWVGVSPKRYLQWLTLGHARTLLQDRRTVLDAAYGAGLSSPGRLHDLFIRWEAMTPGDYARRGAGLTIRTGLFYTPFGPALAMGTERGLCGLAFTRDIGQDAARKDLEGRWPDAAFVEDPDALRPWVEAAFHGGEARLHVMGSPLQIKVWEALLAIPRGQVATYGDVAAAIGSPRAARAVGTAIGRNPLAVLIPCHRALRASGGLGGYHWGQDVKRAILAWETAAAEREAAA